MSTAIFPPEVLQPDPEGYLTSGDIKLLFRLTTSKLCSWLSRGVFPAPDLVLGRKTRYWKRTTVESWAASHAEAGVA